MRLLIDFGYKKNYDQGTFNDFIDLERRIFTFNKVIIKRNDLSIKHLIKLILYENNLRDVPYRSICDMFEL